MLTVTVENFDEIIVVHCLGRIVRGYDHVLLCPAAQQVGRNVVLDLTHVDAIDADWNRSFGFSASRWCLSQASEPHPTGARNIEDHQLGHHLRDLRISRGF